MNRFDRASAAFSDAIAWIYFIVFLITAYDVAARYIFNSPTVWGADLVIALAGIHYMLSGAGALQRGDHVRIDVIYNMLPARMKFLSDILSDLIIIMVLVALVWFGVAQALPSIHDFETTGTAWNAPTPMVMKIAIPVGAALMLAQALVNLARRLRGEVGPPAETADATSRPLD
ncbi:TRAP transporter small permease subunit [Xanthobacter tagetidis]|jgi:TRAP-type mannitol/chloroaromatic compound transport system permease small subunit|uniref:TRAP transporter small permease protein n=1 Tax=Xanthobacter tagetidis TaxID=60216 RepID=A0A3L7AAQ3_9HYPH|nr:TRAP transporter small permease [Xanthobacter tagetidis]MBB6309592.1 TRAP-type mannitol/chloroaromatic compound transport system permease small subunit [Xanthobacter tagetidis]RLP77145.1 TRAP transporter small permease [Xanthobacter tagetidis]